jgi:anaerobic magnesium-protoporphyrin IX monomethyl ester cyclase
MQNVALVFPYFRTRSLHEMLFPPLGAASLAAQLRPLGIETRIFDCTFGSWEALKSGLRSYEPAIIGIYSMISLSRNTIRIAEMVREALPGSLLVAGGPLPTLHPEQYSSHFHAVFRGEADLSFPRFCRDFLAAGASPRVLARLPLETYDGLFISGYGQQVDNPSIHHGEEDIQLFPLPERSDFDHAAYQREWLLKDGTKTTSIMLTLGCPFNCDFCSRPIFGNRFRRRNLDAVLEEIRQIREWGYDSLWIADDNFTLDLSYLEEFCHRAAGMEMTWSCLSRVTGIDGHVASMMKEAGCRRVYLGLETGDQDTLRLMNKKASVEEGIHAVHEFRRAGIETAAFFIVGYPGETLASIETTFDLALTLPLDDISFNLPYPLPGSKLFDRVSGIDPTRDWVEENEATFVYTSEFDQEWLRQRISQTMRAFADKKA